MSTVFKTKIDRIKITRFGSKRGLMYIVKKRLTEIPDYSIWDVHDKLSRDSIVLTREMPSEAFFAAIFKPLI